MANETVEILQIDLSKFGASIGGLKDQIKALKGEIEDLPLDDPDYRERVKELTEAEVLLKDAMYGQKVAVDNVNKSYASMSAEMGRLKAIQKQLDISTEEGRKQFDAMSVTINGLNDQLKELDAQNGVYGRNVGDYANQVSKGFKDLAKDIPSFAKAIHGPLDDVSKSFGLIATNPVFGIATLLAPVITQIVAGLKENEAALSGIRKIMDALQPVFNVINNALQKAVGWVADMVSKLGELAGESTGTFKGIVTGAVGVGNAILQFLLTPIRTVIEAAKGLGNVFKEIFAGNFKEAAQSARTALAGIGDAIKNGIAFKSNFEAGQAIGEQFAQGMKSPKAKAAATAAVKELVEEAAAEGIKQADIDKALAEADRKADEARRKRLEDRKMVDEWFRDEEAALIDEIEGLWDADFAKQQEDVQKQKELMEQRVDALRQVAGATSSILGSLADMYESNTDASERETKKAKALRIAAATIDMLQGAVTAYAAAQSLGVPLGPIVGAVNAAAVIAAGTANIAKIKNTQVSKNGTTSTPTVSASVPAPSQPYTAPEQVRTITSASEEDRLNRMAEPSRVYILQSDIEAAGRASKVQVDESTF